MQFGLTYPVNEGMKFPVWAQPLVKGFVKLAEKMENSEFIKNNKILKKLKLDEKLSKLYKKIKGTKNGKIGYHLEDRELGAYEGHIENGKEIIGILTALNI